MKHNPSAIISSRTNAITLFVQSVSTDAMDLIMPRVNLAHPSHEELILLIPEDTPISGNNIDPPPKYRSQFSVSTLIFITPYNI